MDIDHACLIDSFHGQPGHMHAAIVDQIKPWCSCYLLSSISRCRLLQFPHEHAHAAAGSDMHQPRITLSRGQCVAARTFSSFLFSKRNSAQEHTAQSEKAIISLMNALSKEQLKRGTKKKVLFGSKGLIISPPKFYYLEVLNVYC